MVLIEEYCVRSSTSAVKMTISVYSLAAMSFWNSISRDIITCSFYFADCSLIWHMLSRLRNEKDACIRWIVDTSVEDVFYGSPRGVTGVLPIYVINVI